MKELKEDLIPPLNLDLCLRLDYEGQLVLRLQGMGAVTVGEEESEELMMDAAMEEPEEDLIPLLNLDMLLQLDYEGQLGIRLQGMGAVTVGGEEDVEKLELVLLVKEDTKEPKLVMLEEGSSTTYTTVSTATLRRRKQLLLLKHLVLVGYSHLLGWRHLAHRRLLLEAVR